MQFFQEHNLLVPRLSSWYILGVAVILLALAFQHRILMAWLGMIAVSGVVIVATLSQGTADLSSLTVLLRPLTLLSVGTIFLIPLNLFQRRVSRLRAAERDRLAREVFLHISQTEGRNNALLPLRRHALKEEKRHASKASRSKVLREMRTAVIQVAQEESN